MNNQETELLFVKATRKKIRYESSKGYLQIEDLWDLNLPKLDEIAVSLNEKIEKLGKKSFIGKKVSANDAEIAFEIVKYVIAVRLEEDDARKTRAEKAAKKERLLELLEQKQDESLKNKSEDELKKLIEDLG